MGEPKYPRMVWEARTGTRVPRAPSQREGRNGRMSVIEPSWENSAREENAALPLASPIVQTFHRCISLMLNAKRVTDVCTTPYQNCHLFDTTKMLWSMRERLVSFSRPDHPFSLPVLVVEPFDTKLSGFSVGPRPPDSVPGSEVTGTCPSVNSSRA